VKTLDIAILIYSYFLTGLLIYLIERGMEMRRQLIGLLIAGIVFLTYLLFAHRSPFSNLNYGFLTLPFVAFLVFNLAGFLSQKFSGREFRATWRGGRYFYTEEKNALDHFLSFLIIMIEIAWPILIAIILNRGSMKLVNA